ncbi:hypothetical protein [Enterobacter hormaechei]|uniref:hypothetical protein n=1 Tax=Enterobacter hormaechei TaxID=158836 RepID=UPI0023B16448|nr:hypothetical protein [Enterobacter hormaechei]MDE7845103.1 hypothetical protein [Enterobacter hormaechei]
MIGKILRLLKSERVKKSVNGMSLFTCDNKHIDDLVRIANKDINEINTEGKTPIFYSKTKARTIRLIANGADVNFRSLKTGETPLFSENNINSIKILLKSNADPNYIDHDDDTALEHHFRYHNLKQVHYGNILSLIKATDIFYYKCFSGLFKLKPSFILDVINYLIAKNGRLIKSVPYPYDQDYVTQRRDLLNEYVSRRRHRRSFLINSDKEKEDDKKIIRKLMDEEIKYMLDEDSFYHSESYRRINKPANELTKDDGVYFNTVVLREIAIDNDYDFLFKEIYEEYFLKGRVIENLHVSEFRKLYQSLGSYSMDNLKYFFNKIHPMVLKVISEKIDTSNGVSDDDYINDFLGDAIKYIFDSDSDFHNSMSPSKIRRMIYLTEQLKEGVMYMFKNSENLINYTYRHYELTNKLIDIGVNPKIKDEDGVDLFEKLDPRSQKHYWNYLSEKEKSLIQSCLNKNQRESYKKDESPNRRKRL